MIKVVPRRGPGKIPKLLYPKSLNTPSDPLKLRPSCQDTNPMGPSSQPIDFTPPVVCRKWTKTLNGFRRE